MSWPDQLVVHTPTHNLPFLCICCRFLCMKIYFLPQCQTLQIFMISKVIVKKQFHRNSPVQFCSMNLSTGHRHTEDCRNPSRLSTTQSSPIVYFRSCPKLSEGGACTSHAPSYRCTLFGIKCTGHKFAASEYMEQRNGERTKLQVPSSTGQCVQHVTVRCESVISKERLLRANGWILLGTCADQRSDPTKGIIRGF